MIAADMPLALAVHALADRGPHFPDVAQLRAAYVEAEAALAAFAAVLDDPLADIDRVARRAHLAGLVLRTTLATMPEAFAAQRQTADRMIETLQPFVARIRELPSRDETVSAPRR